MSWLFSQALVAEYSAGSSWDGEPCAQLNVKPTQHKFWRNDRTMEASNLSQFGATCAVLTDAHGEALLMSYLAGFHVRTSALPEKVQASQANDLACGGTWSASLARFDPVSFSWKTAQLSLLGDSELSSVTWPRSGMTADGQLWELPTLERRTRETGFGLWRTPTVGMINADRAKDPEYTARKEAKGQTITLADQVRHERLWPTPTVCGNYNRKGLSKTSGDGLATAVKKWPTPQAHKTTRSGEIVNVDGTPWDGIRKPHSKTTGRQITTALADAVAHGGDQTQPTTLNPNWVEWLMGWPIGWTDLKPLGTDKSHCAQPKHSDS